MKRVYLPLLILSLHAVLAPAAEGARFQQLVLSEEFHSEGACVADIDGDGQRDIVSGPYWYHGPSFRQRFAYAPANPQSIKGYSSFFFCFAYDFNGDDRDDVLTIGMPGQPAYWYENPSQPNMQWNKHEAIGGVGNESPHFEDLTGDGKPELICIIDGNYGYAEPNWDEPTKPWRFTRITTNRNDGQFTHGMGIGDVNGDGRQDLLETQGWWEQTEQLGQPFRFHPQRFAASGGSQMFAFDIDGDNDNDVLSVQNAHGYGLTWFEQRGAGDGAIFVPHPIMTDKAAGHPAGVAISQMHSVAVVDIDGDGVEDIVTGKRFYAHGGGDPGAHELPVLYWFRTTRTANGVEFQPHLMSQRAGVGTQLTVADVNDDGRVDVLVGNKLGTYVFLHEGRVATTTPRVLSASGRRIGTSDFASVIRDSGPRSPADELATFVLPIGFEAQLVAAEPQIAKPMNMAFDARGRLWVSSSSEYPFAAAEGKGRDTIKVLEDTDGDGRANIVTTFADGLNIPMGLYPYQDGVICFSIPHIWFLRDTDGDGKADVREKLYGPMGYDRDTHGMCNGFRRGADGWLYACHGFNNHTTVAGRDGHEISMQSGNTFRMRLDGSRIEHFTHGQVNPFGMAFDSWGDLFSADCHTKPLSLLIQDGCYESFGKPHDGLGFVPSVMEHLHGSTAIGGIAFSPARFPAVFRGNTFHGNVMTCRVNRNSLQRVGSTVRAREEPDLLISGDSWFRPSDIVLGPDGALYVADFYNKIIGHYEVKLDDPRRDRKRGRIWRIVYRGGDERRDAEAALPPAMPSLRKPGDRAIALASDNQTLRTLAQEAMIAHAENSKNVDPVLTPQASLEILLANSRTTHPKVEALWTLHRLGEDDELFRTAFQDRDERVRTHVMRIVADRLQGAANITSLATHLVPVALADDSAMVRRAAALAAAQRAGCVPPATLVDRYHATPDNDVHLRHVLRMALRTQLAPENALRELAVIRNTDRDVLLLARVAIALKTQHAGSYIARHAGQLAKLPREQFTEYLTFAARYVEADDIAQLATAVRQRFASDPEIQVKLLRAVDEGLQQRGGDRPDEVRAWATELARDALSHNEGQAISLGWTYTPIPGSDSTEQTWVISRRRDSADGQAKSALWSSFPRGESRTGIARSESFALGKAFEFYIAGHDGYPKNAFGHKNVVRVRELASQRILREWSPPRNDVAQHQRWETGAAAGSEVFVEMVDADTAAAFAWLAVGRFSETRLNPSRSLQKQESAIALIGDFALNELRGTLVELLQRSEVSPSIRVAAARSLARFERSATISAIAETIAIRGVSKESASQAVRALNTAQTEHAVPILQAAMLAATAGQQRRIAQLLASDIGGTSLLLGLLESGHASLRLLNDATVTQKLAALATADMRQRLAKLREQLPSEDARLQEMMQARITAYLNKPGVASEGVALYAKNCAACHQIAGKGKQVGPNLDGIGNRGMQRLAEDILAPSRNVDVAFMSTAIITEDGQVLSGFVRRVEEKRVILIDRKGEEVVIDRQQIAQQKKSRTSPMPSNFHESLSEAHFRDLLAYLLSLRS